jgi:hypothetical protein
MAMSRAQIMRRCDRSVAILSRKIPMLVLTKKSVMIYAAWQNLHHFMAIGRC